MAVNVKVDGQTYEGIKTITTGGKSLALSAEGGAEWVDPHEYYAENRPAEWPFIPLPSQMSDPDSEYYEAGSCIYFLFDASVADIVGCGFRFAGMANPVATLYKYNNTALVSSETLQIVESGNYKTVKVGLGDSDADWGDYTFAVLKIKADTFTQLYTDEFEYDGKRYGIGNSAGIVEISGNTPDLIYFGSGAFYTITLKTVRFFSLYSSINPMSSYTNAFFAGYYNLEAVVELKTAQLTYLSGMFSACYKLVTIPAFTADTVDTSAATSADSMFSDCDSIEVIPSFDVGNVSSANNMFNGCVSLKKVLGFDMHSVTSAESMFSGCICLESANIINLAALRNANFMFRDCPNVKNIPEFDSALIESANGVFNNCKKLTTSPIKELPNAHTLSQIFAECHSLVLDNFKALSASLGSFSNAFSNNRSLKKITVELSDAASGTSLSSAFSGCYGLRELTLNGVPTNASLTSFVSACQSIRVLDVSRWDLNSASLTNSVFSSCSNLRALIIRSFGSGTVVAANVFSSCPHFTGSTDYNFNPSGAKDGYIYVPDDMVETIKAATNWSTYASQIKGLSELPAA